MTARPSCRLLLGMLAVVWISGCTRSSGDPRSVPVAQQPLVVIQTATRALEVKAELARTDQERERGLMFRERLGTDEGMLFVFPDESERVFWMKNTLIPLDMIFIDGQGKIVGIVAKAEPQTEIPRSVDSPSRYVLEVTGGWAEEHGVRAGNRVTFRGLTAVR